MNIDGRLRSLETAIDAKGTPFATLFALLEIPVQPAPWRPFPEEDILPAIESNPMLRALLEKLIGPVSADELAAEVVSLEAGRGGRGGGGGTAGQAIRVYDVSFPGKTPSAEKMLHALLHFRTKRTILPFGGPIID